MKKAILLFVKLFIAIISYSQVGINTDGTNPDESAILDIKSTSLGLLIPRMTETEKNAIALPATGLLVFQTNGAIGFYYNKGTPVSPNWEILSADNLGNHAATENIKLTGNWLSNDGGDEGIFVSEDGKVGVGNATPSTKLDVDGIVTATSFSGDGSGLSGISGDNLGNHTATENLNLNNNKIINLSEPTTDTDAATKQYVDNNSGDNLGNHIASENVQLTGNWLSNDGESEGLYVADNGFVGINTNTPGSELMVDGHIVSSGMIFASPGSITEPTFRFGQGEENTGFSSPDYQTISAITYGVERMRISHNGNVGIGVSNPSSELEVNGTIEATSFVGDGSGLTGVSGDNLGNHTANQNIKMLGNWLSNDGGNEGVFVTSAGNVGINTSSPTSTLDVDGYISSLDGIVVNWAPEYGVYVNYSQKSAINIWKAGNPSSTTNNLSSNGITIQGAEGNGLYVGRADGKGVHINETNSDGVYVYKAGNPGSTHSSSLFNGFEVEGAEGNGLFVGRADYDGVHVKEAGDFGFWVEESGSTGLVIQNAGNIGIDIGSTTSCGISIAYAGTDGVKINNAGNPSTQHNSTLKNGFEVAGAEGNGLCVGQADLDGAYIYKAGSPSNTISSSYNNGIEVAGAEGYGLYVGQADLHGILVWKTTSNGIHVGWAGQHGIAVNNAVKNGISVYTAGNDGIYVQNAGDPSTLNTSSYNNGFEVAGAEGHGMFVGQTDMDGIHIKKAGTISTTSSSSLDNGVEIEGAAGYGLYVGNSGNDGVYLANSGGDGVYIYDAEDFGFKAANVGEDGFYVQYPGDDGFYVYSAVDDGLYVNNAGDRAIYSRTTDASNEWGLYTPDKVYANNVTSKGSSSYAKNSGNSSLEPGDIVCISGGWEENVLDGAGFPVVNISKATKSNSQAVFGVVEYKVNIREEYEEAPEGESPELKKSFEYADGNVMPGNYLSVIVFGQADVKINTKEDINHGEPVSCSENGARKVRTTEINGITIAENVGILGKALENSNGKGKIKVFVNCK